MDYAVVDYIANFTGVADLLQTNNKSATPVALWNGIIETLDDIKSKNSGSRVAFSSIFKRNDELHLIAKVIQTSKILKATLRYRSPSLDYDKDTFEAFMNLL